jgi:predicted nucleic-acid-binding Zn-ribbon protein
MSACPDCRDAGHWLVSPMREHRFTGYGQLGYIDDIEPLETHICDGCGYTVWYSRGIGRLREDRGRVAKLDDERLSCVSCYGRRHYLVAQLQEWPEGSVLGQMPLHVLQTGKHEGVGRFALLICGDCGRCQWFAWGTGTPTTRATGVMRAQPQPDLPCSRCRAIARYAVEPVREDGGLASPVAVQRQRAIGHFGISFCNACGYCEWYARDLAALRSDGERVSHVNGDRYQRAPVAGGPYR